MQQWQSCISHNDNQHDSYSYLYVNHNNIDKQLDSKCMYFLKIMINWQSIVVFFYKLI
jgi:hypothetical protein